VTGRDAREGGAAVRRRQWVLRERALSRTGREAREGGAVVRRRQWVLGERALSRTERLSEGPAAAGGMQEFPM